MIKVNDVGFQFINAGGFEANRPSGSGDYLFVHLRTSAQVNLHGQWHNLPADTYLIFRKGSPQIYYKKDGNFINDWIHFDIEPHLDYFENLNIPLDTPIYLPGNPALTTPVADMVLEYFGSNPEREKNLGRLADTLFHNLSNLYAFSRQYSMSKRNLFWLMSTLQSEITHYGHLRESVEELAALLNLSPSYFQHSYKEFFGKSVLKEIIEARIRYASNLLCVTDYNITQIGHMCGYDNPEHFSRIFKKYTGLSPRQYRNTQSKQSKD